MSLIFWTLTLVGLIKYVFIVLRADDQGEGGTFALYARLARVARLPTPTATEQEYDTNLARFGTKIEGGVKPSIATHRVVLVLVLIATCMLIGDGCLTPSISVVSSISGLKQISSIGNNAVIGISCAVLVLLYVFQRLGTSKLGVVFAPVILLWFFSNFCIGIYNIVVWYPGIFKALSPHYMIFYWRDEDKLSWEVLSGVLLCITGVEAMYADLGHFSRQAVQLSYCCIVYPAVLITYLGQAAFLMNRPESVADTFYDAIPDPVYWPMFVISILAAIVASQAIISGTFSIIRQSLMLGCFPRVKIVHTSGIVEGQIYIPEANWTLMVLTIIVVAGFRDSLAISNAYGVAVTFVMLITTILMTLGLLVIWKHNILTALAFFVIFGLIDVSFLSAALNKFLHGGWFPIALSGILFTVSVLWYWGTKRKVDALDSKKGIARTVALKDGGKIARVPGVAMVYTNTYTGIPAAFTNLLSNVPALHEVVVFITVRYVPIPKVSLGERLLFMPLPVPGLYRCVARYGYTDPIDEDGEFTKAVLNKIAKHSKPELAAKLIVLPGKAIEANMKLVYVMGRTMTHPKPGTGMIRQFFLEHTYNFLRRNSRTASGAFNVPRDRLVEVGVVVEI
ncbi:potassium transporter [Coccomyxa subellipsoidea C-169]|uniref:Potassium transporter n=1 Tax=Coccomyxa subellipsoidea (strain C-169) TaxID=574566 RepID=I0YU14_COCSC|nr:potassium transporter [Coccomyxa subellipsoidea C-169]EIE21883.1 potassium transporter [Coccomyxa subellipsoidea C-169]|eukprot:XP_005646427.1 potassium transporter [Coccomyxa subellipsoidea C-169]